MSGGTARASRKSESVPYLNAVAQPPSAVPDLSMRTINGGCEMISFKRILILKRAHQYSLERTLQLRGVEDLLPISVNQLISGISGKVLISRCKERYLGIPAIGQRSTYYPKALPLL